MSIPWAAVVPPQLPEELLELEVPPELEELAGVAVTWMAKAGREVLVLPLVAPMTMLP